MLEFLQTKQSHANFSTSAMETGNHLKNGVKSIKNYELQITRKCALFLVAVLLAFVGFTHKAVGQTQTWNIGHNSVQGGDYLPNVTATLNGNTLTISGSGNMADFWCTGTNQYDAGGEAPWHPNYRNVINTVVFQSGSNVQNIGMRAFKECTNLETIIIPNSVLKINGQAFYGCSSLHTVELENGSNPLQFVGYQANNICSGTNINTYDWFEGCISLSTLHLGRNYSGDFISNIRTTLTTLTIGNTVTTIGSSAFANCNLLKTVTFQDGIGTLTLTTGYNSYTFSNSPIETLHIGRPLTISDTGRQPFAEKATIHNLTFGESVVSIGSNAFNGCTGLTKITSNPTTPPTIQSNTFTGVNPNIPVHVPCVLAYQFSPWGNSFSNFFQIGDCPDEPNLYTLNILSNNTAYGHATSINMLSGAVLTSTWNFEGNLSTSTSAQFSGKAILMANAKNNSVFLGWNDGNLEPMRIVDITDNKTYTAQFETCSNGVGEMKTTPSISVYPNPTNGQLIIHTSQLAMDNAEYSIYSTMGQMIMRGKLQGEATIINVASLINGIYYLRIGDQTVKFVKE